MPPFKDKIECLNQLKYILVLLHIAAFIQIENYLSFRAPLLIPPIKVSNQEKMYIVFTFVNDL